MYDFGKCSEWVAHADQVQSEVIINDKYVILIIAHSL